MTDLLTVKMISPDVKSFDPLPAVHYFHQGRHRRPIFGDKKAGMATPAASAAAESEEAAEEAITDFDAEREFIYSDYESDYESDCNPDIDIEQIANDEDF